MTIVAGDILRTSCNFTIANNTQYQNVFHHQRTGVGILSDAAHVSAIEDWCNAMYAEIANRCRSGVVGALSSVDKVEFVEGGWTVVESIGVFTPDFNPSDIAAQLPNQSSCFATFITMRPKSTGRKFLFPMTSANVIDGILNPTIVASMVAWADDAVNDIVIQALDNLVPGIVRTGVDAWLPFILGVVTNVTGSQRRRRPGEGS